jgi:PAS domain S-box-containing protein
MPHPPQHPINSEREFKLTELFFSVTDAKGIILSGNEVFTRISGYSSDELIGAPHNIIRHPDMPRAVFQLLWDYIQAGKTIAAYVKNMAKDGSYYWVIALVLPVPEGYISIRLKPISALFEKIKKVYAVVLAAEKSSADHATSKRKGEIEAGTRQLNEILRSEGFATYDEFMWAALRTEMAAREAALAANSKLLAKRGGTTSNIVEQHWRQMKICSSALDLHLRNIFSNMDNLVLLNEKLLPKSKFVLELAESIHLLSLNAEINSRRLSSAETGRTLSMVAEKMGAHTLANADVLTTLNQRMISLATPLGQLLLDVVAAKLQVEMISFFIDEQPIDPLKAETQWTDVKTRPQIDLLVAVFLQRINSILPNLEQLSEDLNLIRLNTGKIQSFVRNLRFIHFLGQVEAARTPEGISFRYVFEEVMKQTEKGDVELGEFSTIIASNMNIMGRMLQIKREVITSLEMLKTVSDL